MQEAQGLRGASGERVVDPVCGMQVNERSTLLFRYGDVEYRFCSAQCRERFARQPEAFLEPDAQR